MNLDPDWAAVYTQVGRLLATMPNFSSYEALSHPDALLWIGRAKALVDTSNRMAMAASFNVAMAGINKSTLWQSSVRDMILVLYQLLGHAELYVGPAKAGSFVPAGNQFDALAAITKIFQSAKKDILIVDPYLDETVLTDFALAVPEGVPLRLLADEASHKPTLAPAATRWVAQYASARPLSARLAPPRTLHDRALLIDGTIAWVLTQSLKDFAKRSPAEIVRADDTASLKVDAYEAIWTASRAIA